MKTKVLNYRVIVEPDVIPGSNKKCYLASCHTLGVFDNGDTIDEALKNVQDGIEGMIEFLTEEGKEIPVDSNKAILMNTEVLATDETFRLAFS